MKEGRKETEGSKEWKGQMQDRQGIEIKLGSNWGEKEGERTCIKEEEEMEKRGGLENDKGSGKGEREIKKKWRERKRGDRGGYEEQKNRKQD